MTEPREIAEKAEEVVPGLYHWHIHNSNIGGSISSSHALVDGDACVLIDPVRLAGDALAAWPEPGNVLLSARCHQRAAWRYRRELGAEVGCRSTRPPPTRSPTTATARATRCPAASWRCALPALSGRTTPSCGRATRGCCSAPT